MITFDNRERPLGSPARASAVTSGFVKGRRLGVSEVVEAEFASTVVITGINLR